MENKFTQDEVAYKYLDSYGKAFINGMHAVLDDLRGLLGDGANSEISEIIGDDIIEEISESSSKDRADKLKAYDVVGEYILKKVSDVIQNRVEGEIMNSIEGFADGDDDYEEHKAEVDKHYAEIELIPDMTLIDSEGATFGVIRSVITTETGTTCVVVREDVVEDDDEDMFGGAKEVELTEDDVKTFALMKPYPMYVSYQNGKKTSHYKYGGDKVEDIQ